MKSLMSLIKTDRGTTLIELMVALVLTGIVTLAIMKTYVTQHENYLVQDDVTTMQQGARACIDELTRQIRMAGHDTPPGMPPIIAANTNPDTITITYHGNDCDSYLSAAMPSTSAELKLATDVSCFSADQWVYIYDPDSLVGEWFLISHVQVGSNHIQHRYEPKDLSRAYQANALLLALNRVKFFVDNTTEPENSRLMIQINYDPPMPYADNISDLQFRYRLANGNVIDEPVLLSDIREVMISITAQSTRPPGASADAGSDDQNTKDRTYTSSVSLRNLGV